MAPAKVSSIKMSKNHKINFRVFMSNLIFSVTPLQVMIIIFHITLTKANHDFIDKYLLQNKINNAVQCFTKAGFHLL